MSAILYALASTSTLIDPTELDSPSRVTAYNALLSLTSHLPTYPPHLLCTDPSCPLNSLSPAAPLSPRPHHSGPYNPHPSPSHPSHNATLPLAPHAVYNAMDWLECLERADGKDECWARCVERWEAVWRSWEEVHGWTVVKKTAPPAAAKKQGKEWKMGGWRREVRREPGTVVIGSGSRMAREREATKAKLMAEKKGDGKGKGKEVQVQVQAAQQALSVISEEDRMSERSDTTDVRRMKESKFVWADDE
ncbi:hypothetical protein Q9189_005026 [Teloschistes chrysophthalmus]